MKPYIYLKLQGNYNYLNLHINLKIYILRALIILRGDGTFQ
jgi:hypothetical protein